MKGSPVIIKASKKTHKYGTSTSKSFKKLSRGYQRCVWPPQLKKTRKRQTTYKTITSDIAYFSQPTKPPRRSHEDWWHPTTEKEDDLLSQGNPWSPSIVSEHVDSPCKCSVRDNLTKEFLSAPVDPRADSCNWRSEDWKTPTFFYQCLPAADLKSSPPADKLKRHSPTSTHLLRDFPKGSK